MRSSLALSLCLALGIAFLSGPQVFAQGEVPAWCSALPRPEYKSLTRVPMKDTWFEVYKVVPGVLAIYEPHQSEETIGYLILGSKRALMFDTGMGIGDLKALISQLT